MKLLRLRANKESFHTIPSVNQCTLDLLTRELTEEEYQILITDNEVLELNDVSDVNKLLGIQVDLNYDRSL